MVLPQLRYGFYRVSTILRSLKTLYTLSPEKVKAFVESYDVYNYDWNNEEQLIRSFGPDYYTQVKKRIIDFYSVLNLLCSIGQIEKMYIPPAMDLSKSISANQKLFEQKMSRDLAIGQGSKVLDIGCGRGRIATYMATISNADVTGMNIDGTQLESARQFLLGKSLSERCRFQQADLNDFPFPFPDASFDAIYNVGAFTYSKDLKKIFREISRLLKPGGKFASLDWIRLPNYDSANPHHADLLRRIKPLVGAIGTPSMEEYTGALQEAGLRLLINENASIDGLQAPLIENTHHFFSSVKKGMEYMVRFKLLPAHFKVLFDRMTKDGEAFIEADRMRIVTSSYYLVGQK